MSTEPTTAVAVREVAALGVPLAPMSDSEFAAVWRTAKGYAESGLFKDARQAGEAFAKIMAGRCLGLNDFESMSALHVIQGKIEAGADLHATRVRSRDGYDYRVAWIKETPVLRVSGEPQRSAIREAVYASDDVATDMREIVGCAIEFTVDGVMRGVSTFTKEDQARAQLANLHSKYPRNMWFARAMTNGVAWFVPEVMGGLRVYGPGEIASDPDLTAVDGEAVTMPEPDSLPTAVEAIIARARSLGHGGLANRAAAAMAVGNQPPATVEKWCRDATATLNRVAAGKPEPEPEPEDAVVVEPPAPVIEWWDDPKTGKRHRRVIPAEPVSGDLSPQAPHPANPPSEPIPASEAPAAAPEPGDLDTATGRAADAMAESFDEAANEDRIAALRRRGEELLASADGLAEDDPRRDEIEQEFGQIADEVERLEGPGEGQATLL